MIKKRLKPITYFAICLLFLHSGLSVAAAYRMESLNNTALTDGSERILVCTSEGFKWISIAELNQLTSDSELSPNNGLINSHDCALCTFNVTEINSIAPGPFFSIGLSPHYIFVSGLIVKDFSGINDAPPSDKLSRAPPILL